MEMGEDHIGHVLGRHACLLEVVEHRPALDAHQLGRSEAGVDQYHPVPAANQKVRPW